MARRVRLHGTVDGAELRVVARRRDPERFMIRGRGFRWVQPYPFWDRQ
jgi:hypothetical protein